jgi:hypothetical protein
MWCLRRHKLHCQHSLLLLLLLLLLLTALLSLTPSPECLVVWHLRPTPLGNSRRLLHWPSDNQCHCHLFTAP